MTYIILLHVFVLLRETSYSSSQLQDCNFIKKETLAHVFSCEFCEISKNSFFTEHLWWLLLMLITIIRFGRYRILLASNCTFMSDSHYWGTIQIWQNLDEHQYYLTSTKSVICQIDTNCSPFQSLSMLPFHIRLQCLTLLAPVSQNGQTHSNNSSANCRRIVWVCLTI